MHAEWRARKGYANRGQAGRTCRKKHRMHWSHGRRTLLIHLVQYHVHLQASLQLLYTCVGLGRVIAAHQQDTLSWPRQRCEPSYSIDQQARSAYHPVCSFRPCTCLHVRRASGYESHLCSSTKKFAYVAGIRREHTTTEARRRL